MLLWLDRRDVVARHALSWSLRKNFARHQILSVTHLQPTDDITSQRAVVTQAVPCDFSSLAQSFNQTQLELHLCPGSLHGLAHQASAGPSNASPGCPCACGVQDHAWTLAAMERHCLKIRGGCCLSWARQSFKLVRKTAVQRPRGILGIGYERSISSSRSGRPASPFLRLSLACCRSRSCWACWRDLPLQNRISWLEKQWHRTRGLRCSLRCSV